MANQTNSLAQDMKFRQSLMVYAQKYGVTRASRRYNKLRSYIYRWKVRWDGTIQSLACQSRWPHSHPNAHIPEEINMILRYRRRNPCICKLSISILNKYLLSHLIPVILSPTQETGGFGMEDTIMPLDLSTALRDAGCDMQLAERIMALDSKQAMREELRLLMDQR